MGIRKLSSVAIFLATSLLVNAQASAFTQVIVFGDSLSDDGNIAHRVRDTFGFSYPSSNPPFNYSDYRFTDDSNTSPATSSGLRATGITIKVYAFDVWLDVIRVLSQPRRYGFVDTIDSAQDRSGSIQTNIFTGMIFTLPLVATTIWPTKRIDC